MTHALAVVAVVLVACGGADEVVPDAPPDAPPDACAPDPGVTITLDVVLPGDEPRLSVTIDGASNPATLEIASHDAALATRVDIAIELDDVALFTVEAPAYAMCLDLLCGDTHVDVERTWCLLPSGDLRLQAQHASSNHGTCVEDGFCWPQCWPRGTECPGERCGSVRLHDALTATALRCVPIGAGAAGDACSYGAGGEGTGHDTCGAGLVCVDAVCREICRDTDDCVAGTCANPPGHAEEMRACLP